MTNFVTAVLEASPSTFGPAYSVDVDGKRIGLQMKRIYGLMRDTKWRTLGEISSATGDSEASISAQLRHLRKAKFGGHTVNKRHRGLASYGFWEYQLLTNGGN